MRILPLILLVTIIACSKPAEDKPSPLPQKQITQFKDDARAELPEGEAKEMVVANCVHCHGHKLITQNSASREGWQNMIIWMQETQGLWPLGPNEDKILDYLAEHFAPQNKGRRSPLTDIEWYELD